MSGRHKFTELEAGMSPARRARINRLASKLDAELTLAQSDARKNVDYKRLHELSHEFTQLWIRLQAFYLDSVAGFALVRNHIEAKQAVARTLVAGTELDSEAFQNTRMFTYAGIFSDDFFTGGINQLTRGAGIQPTQGDAKVRNAVDGTNFVTLGQLCLISFYDFWEDYLRLEYVIAKGLLDRNDSKENTDARLREHASHELWGDLYRLRTSIVHNRGIADSNITKCKLVKWFKPGDRIAITPERMRVIFIALLMYRNELFAEHFPPSTHSLQEYAD